jgi:hypothetical protein
MFKIRMDFFLFVCFCYGCWICWLLLNWLEWHLTHKVEKDSTSPNHGCDSFGDSWRINVWCNKWSNVSMLKDQVESNIVHGKKCSKLNTKDEQLQLVVLFVPPQRDPFHCFLYKPSSPSQEGCCGVFFHCFVCNTLVVGIFIFIFN